ncbi:hypothetical protein CUMW_043990 [Citrus unshiu]|nr:hypothetical protein CUMW_043990 [Citrus unshiu]
MPTAWRFTLISVVTCSWRWPFSTAARNSRDELGWGSWRERHTTAVWQWLLWLSRAAQPCGACVCWCDVRIFMHFSRCSSTSGTFFSALMNTVTLTFFSVYSTNQCVHLHVVSLARIFAILSSRGYIADDAVVLRSIRIPILDGDRVAERVLSVCGELPGCSIGVQFDLPLWCASAARLERRLQRNWRLDFQFCAQCCDFVVVHELLREDVFEEQENWRRFFFC